MLVAAVLGAIGWLWSTQGRSEDREAGAGAVEDRKEAGGASAFGVPGEGGAAPVRELVVDGRPAAERDGAGVVASARKHVLRGTFVVSDARGVEHAREDGECTLALVYWSEGPGFTVEVEDGAWSLEVADLPDRLVVLGGKLGGRPVHVASALNSFAVDAGELDRPLSLRGVWLEQVTLRVLSSVTQQDLADVRVVEASGVAVERGAATGRSAGQIVFERATSPIRFPAPEGSIRKERELWVWAPGHAWAKVTLDLLDPTERSVVLVPAGDVVVTMIGEAPDPEAVLRLYEWREGAAELARTHAQIWGRPLDELRPASGGPTRISGITPGSYWVSLERGLWYRTPILLGGAKAEVTAQSTVNVTLTVTASQGVPPPLPVAGEIVVPVGWSEDFDPKLRLMPEASLASRGVEEVELTIKHMHRVDARTFGWSTDGLPPGRYAALVEECCFLVPFEVGPQGNERVRIELPAPGDLLVRFVDAQTGREIEVEHASWWTDRAVWEGGVSGAPLRRQETGGWATQVLPGRIRIAGSAEGYVVSDAHFDARPGRNELTVRLEPACGVELVLRDGEAVVPWDNERWQLQLQDANGRSGIRYWSGGRFTAFRPGEYTLHLRGPAEYQAVAERQVTVEATRFTRVEIELRRPR